MDRVLLFFSATPGIKVTVEIYFDEAENLVLEGYDIGKTVEEYWGDSDYEYVIRIPAASFEFLFQHFQMKTRSRLALLQELARRYNTNYCYSEIRKLLDDHKVIYEGYTWT